MRKKTSKAGDRDFVPISTFLDMLAAEPGAIREKIPLRHAVVEVRRGGKVRREEGATYAGGGEERVSFGDISPEVEKAFEEAIDKLSAPPKSLVEKLSKCQENALFWLQESAYLYQPPFDRFPVPFGLFELTPPLEEELEREGIIRLSDDEKARMREARDRGDFVTFGTHVPPSPYGTRGWVAWHILDRFARLAAAKRACDLLEYAHECFNIAGLFFERTQIDRTEAATITGRRASRSTSAAAAEANEKKAKAALKRDEEWVKSLKKAGLFPIGVQSSVKDAVSFLADRFGATDESVRETLKKRRAILQSPFYAPKSAAKKGNA